MDSGEEVDDVDVLVVGAGPTGLMLANWLVRLGVRTATVDGKAGPTAESRALGVHSRSMEIYDQLGVVDRVLAEAAPVVSMRQGYGRTAFAPIPLTGLGRGITPYPGMYVLEQSANERILLDHLTALGGSVRWRHRMTGLEWDDDGVTVRLEGPDGHSAMRARFVVGCDGASSAVRASCGIAFDGTTNRQTFFLVDAVGVTGLAPASVNIRQGAGGFLLAFPMTPDATGRARQRLIGIAGDDVPAVTEEFARRSIAHGFGVTYDEHRWFSTYRVHHRVAARFRLGPVLLAGDAAHVHSPVGAQGMNTGLQDAHNLAFKLAEVVAGRASAALLDRYEQERRPVALRLLRTTDLAFRGITTTSAFAKLVRRYVPRLVLPVAVAVLPRLPLGRRLAGYLGQLRIHYPMDAGSDGASRSTPAAASGHRRPPGSPSSRARRAFRPFALRRRRDVVVGRRLHWTGENHAVLRSASWQLHQYAADQAALRQAQDAAEDLGLPLHSFATTGSAPLAPGIVYLVRPDGFVAASSPPGDAARTFAAAVG